MSWAETGTRAREPDSSFAKDIRKANATLAPIIKAKKAVVVGTLTRALKAGRSTVTVKVTGKARKALKKARSVKFGVAVAAKDAAGNGSAKSATLSLKQAKKKK